MSMSAAQHAAAVARYAASAGASNSSEERHDSLVQKPRAPLKTIEDALQTVITECQRDSFWADMAKPAVLAIEHMRAAEADNPNNDPLKQNSDAREKALMLLRHLNEQLQSASDANMFKHEATMVKFVLQAVEGDASLKLSSPLSAVADAAHLAQQNASEQSRNAEANIKSEKSLEAVRKAMVPFVFKQTQDVSEMTVEIAVPPGTKARDVSVSIKRESLVVKVAGHALQPTVIDGIFRHSVDHEACDWHLEGSGETRVLILDLEKTAAGLDWSSGLLSVGRSGEAKSAYKSRDTREAKNRESVAAAVDTVLGLS